MKFKFKKYIIAIVLLLATPTLAANTAGYAWSESLGWFDFSNVTISDTTVTGHAYNDNTGWLVLDGVTNNAGTLGGYAWSESVGWFDFSRASISNGSLTGYAYNDNTGWLSFGAGTSVTTTWAPATAPTAPTTPTATHTAGGAFYGGGGSSGGGLSSIPMSLRTPATPSQVNTPTNIQIITTISNNPRNLTTNTKGDDVRLLQKFLNQQGFTIASTGVGSPGQETNFFGSLTRQALARFQAANNIRPSAGYFGPITRAFIRSLLVTN